MQNVIIYRNRILPWEFYFSQSYELFSFVVSMGIEHGTSHLLNKHSTTDLYLQLVLRQVPIKGLRTALKSSCLSLSSV